MAVAEGGEGKWNIGLPELLHDVVKQIFWPCWAFRFPGIPFFFASSAGVAAPHVTGTVIFHEQGKARLCLQFEPSISPFIFLDLPITAASFFAGIRGGGCRMTFERHESGETEKPPLCQENVWEVSLNGKKAGYAIRPEMTEPEKLLLYSTRKVSAGAAIVAPPTAATERMLRSRYLRGKFERVVGSEDSESYHLVDPDGDLGHVLSIFFLRRQ